MKNSNIITIIKKEFARFFGDKRLVFTTLIMPGLLIYVLYSFMGDGLMNMFKHDENYKAKVYIRHLPESVSAQIMTLGMDIQIDDTLPNELIKQNIENKIVDLLVIFPENFDQKVSEYNILDFTQKAPNIEIYQNSTNKESKNAYTIVSSILNAYESSLENKFDINMPQDSTTDANFDMATEEDVAGKVFSSLLPFLLLIFMYSGCMAVAPESIAGEKERGTIATLLVTPMKRSELAIGKIVSLSIIALLSGVSSFLGTMLSLPKLMGAGADGISANIYSTGDYILLLAIILSTVLVIISLISIVSAYAKTVKESATMIVPLMLLIMLVGITSMLGEGPQTDMSLYFIPLYNSVQCMNAIFSFDYNALNTAITLISNVVYAGILAFLLTKIFNNEKIMFSR